MEFTVDTDKWFIFTILFIGTLTMFIFGYIVIPYFARKKNINRIKQRHKRKQDNYKKLEKRFSNRKITDLENDNQKLQIALKNDLEDLLKSNLKTCDLLPFFSNFEKIYPNFAKSLQKTIPGITANELKLCAMLRLNLSAKEVSQLFSITPASVNKARYRIRKKIGLNSKDDLFVFLSSV